MSSFDFVTGEILLIDKPYEWTSFDVVKKVRNAIKIKKVGHCGTLDPLATGLLIVCTGKKTKQIESIQATEKEYMGIIELGRVTASYDLETEPENPQDISHITEEGIMEAVQAFIGEIEQTPPIFSAVKVDGKRAYKSARAGKKVEIKSRNVTVSEFEITQVSLPDVHFRVVCSKGTYIRSLANDLGQKLGVGGYLKALKRTRIGDYKLMEAYELASLITDIKAQQAQAEQNTNLPEKSA